MTLDELLFDAGALWLAAAVLLGLAELAIPGVFLIFLAIAAAITGVATLALPDLPLAAQLASFAAWTAVAVLVGKRWYVDYPVETTDPLLNDRAARLIGSIVIVEDAIFRGVGRVRIGDGAWLAYGPDVETGARVRIVGHDGAALQVEAVAPSAEAPDPAE